MKENRGKKWLRENLGKAFSRVAIFSSRFILKWSRKRDYPQSTENATVIVSWDYVTP